MQFSIKVYKEYFNFASSHFLIFNDGSREPLHGHNYRVSVVGHAIDLNSDMVFDFLHIKPIVRDICDSLDHRLLIPKMNPLLDVYDDKEGEQFRLSLNQKNIVIKKDKKAMQGHYEHTPITDYNHIPSHKFGSFSIPKLDCLLLPLENISAERLAQYIANEVERVLSEKFSYRFKSLEIEVEETKGQSAIYKKDDSL